MRALQMRMGSTAKLWVLYAEISVVTNRNKDTHNAYDHDNTNHKCPCMHSVASIIVNSWCPQVPEDEYRLFYAHLQHS